MSRIRVALFEDRAQLEVIQRRLGQAGIRAEIHDELGVAKLWFVSRRRAGVRLEVSARDALRARQLLSAWDAEGGCLRDAIRCPECKSLRIDYPQCTHKSLFTNLAIGLIAELRLVERQYYCEDCHCMWAKPDERPRHVRKHMAPAYFLEDFGEHSVTEAGAGRPAPASAFAASRTESRFRIFKPWRRSPRVKGGLGGILLVVGTSSAIVALGAQPPSNTSSAPTYLRDVMPILMGKCARCHESDGKVLQNWLDYRTASSKRWEIKRRVWDSPRGEYFKQPMPTANSPESQAMTEEERRIIRDWVESGAPYGVRPALTGVQSKAERMEQGQRLFTTICAACHQPTGQGIPGRFPPLAGSDFLNSDKHRAIQVVINGLQGEVIVNGQKFNNVMPRFPLSDGEIASALTFVYNSLGNSGKEVTAEEVNAARQEKEDSLRASQTAGTKVPEEKSPYE